MFYMTTSKTLLEYPPYKINIKICLTLDNAHSVCSKRVDDIFEGDICQGGQERGSALGLAIQQLPWLSKLSLALVLWWSTVVVGGALGRSDQRLVETGPNRSCGGSPTHRILMNRNRTTSEVVELEPQVRLQPVLVQSSCSFLQFTQLDF